MGDDETSDQSPDQWLQDPAIGVPASWFTQVAKREAEATPQPNQSIDPNAGFGIDVDQLALPVDDNAVTNSSAPSFPGLPGQGVLVADSGDGKLRLPGNLRGGAPTAKTGSVSYGVADSANGETIEKAIVKVAGQSSNGGIGTFLKVSEGKQPYNVSAPLYEPVSGTVVVTAGKETRLEISLTSKVKMSQPRPVTDDKAPARQRGKGEVVLDETAISMGRTLGPAVVGPSSDTLYALLDESGKPLETPGAAKLNSDGAEMLEVWGRFAKLYANWNNKYSTVKLNLRFRQWGKEKCKVVV